MTRCVGDISTFERCHWGRRPLLRRHEPGAFDDVWSVAAFDDFLASGVRRPLIRLVADGEPVAEKDYTAKVRLGGVDFADVIDPEKVARKLAAGATVVGQSLHRTHRSVRQFTRELSDDISHPVQANSYLTPPGAQGLAPHVDGHDVFVIQLDGSKCWTVDGEGDVNLGSGDVLYLPAGTRHSAVSTNDASLHLTIGILVVTYRAVLDRLLLDGPSVLDEPLPLRYRNGDSPLEAHLHAMLLAVANQLRVTDVSALAAREVSRRPARPPRPGALVAATELSNELAAIDASTMIVRADTPWSISKVAKERVEIVAAGQRLSAPRSCDRAFDQLAGGDALAVDDLDGLDAESRLVIVRRLVAAGLCRIAGSPGTTSEPFA